MKPAAGDSFVSTRSGMKQLTNACGCLRLSEKTLYTMISSNSPDVLVAEFREGYLAAIGFFPSFIGDRQKGMKRIPRIRY
jgi:hypothetical protein